MMTAISGRISASPVSSQACGCGSSKNHIHEDQHHARLAWPGSEHTPGHTEQAVTLGWGLLLLPLRASQPQSGQWEKPRTESSSTLSSGSPYSS